jgi:serine/threonine protein kinase
MNDSGRDEGLLREAMAGLDRLLDLSHAERVASLTSLAQSQPKLHALVLEMLAQEESVNRGFMEPETKAGLLPDSRLGPWRIIRLLGEGGMGEVWLARRDDGLYEGQVAIKTLHPHFAGGLLHERFLREAKVLGRLAHSNIARLLDAGIHEGVVYLVLEYVVGRPIDVACDEDKVGIDGRLGVFLRLCAAVAHAHETLVVHRDIKPGNVLLTRDGVPKLLDFGIANFYEPHKGDSKSDLTRMTGRIFTPEYAAPEQILEQDITTAADVYSMGVLLYVLLTGQLPYRPTEEGRVHWEQAVLNEEPQRMVRTLDLADHEAVAARRSMTFAQLRRELGGDLENIVQKALKKKPEDRYPSVAALADDIKRYLQGEPILARADSAWYRLGKFAQRNRLAVGAALAVVAALGAGLGVSLWQLQVARNERRHAEEVKEFVASIFRSADPFFTGKASMTAADLLSLARVRIDQELLAKPQNAVELLYIVGESQINIEENEAAKATLTKAYEIAEKLQPRDEVLLAEVRVGLASVARNGRDFAAARAMHAESIPVLRKHQPRGARMLSNALGDLAYIESEEGQLDASVQLARESVTVAENALGSAHTETIMAKRNLALFLVLAKRAEEARPLAEQALRDVKSLSASGTRNALLVATESTYGRLLLELNEPEAAAEHLNAGIETAVQVYGPKGDAVAPIRSLLMRVQVKQGDVRAALATAHVVYDTQANAGNHLEARMMTNLGRYTLLAGQVAESLEPLRRAIELENRYDKGKASWLSLAQQDYAAALALSGRLAEADRVLEEALPFAREAGHPSALPGILNAVGLSHQLRQQWKESEAAYREAFDHTTSNDINLKQRIDALLGIGVASLETGRTAEAEEWIRKADETARATFLKVIPLRADIAVQLGRTLLAREKLDEARDSIAVADGFWQDFDADNRRAGEAAYWLGKAHDAAGSAGDARAALSRAVGVLKGSTLPWDMRMVADARTILARSGK